MPEQIWLVVESVDMRKGVEGLTAMAQLALGHSTYGSAAFFFIIVWAVDLRCYCGMRKVFGCVSVDYMKDVLFGLKSNQHIKQATVFFSLTQAQWAWLIAGLDWQKLSAKLNPNWQV
jgi:transposase